MNSDIRVSATLLQHHKTKKLIRVLGLGVIYYLLRLWTYTAQYRPDGILKGMTAEDIAVAIDWLDEPDDLIRPLCEIGFLEQCEEGEYRIHKWDVHNPYAAHAKERSEKARKAARARWGDAKECSEHALSMPVASPSNAPSPTPTPEEDSTPNGVLVDNGVADAFGGPQNESGPSSCPHQEIIDLYHRILPELRRVRVWSDQRKRFLRARWREDQKHQTLEWWEGFFEYVRGCPHLMGTNGNGGTWQADLEWLVRPLNFVKVIEGKYAQ
jgi:hypothetical protein